MFACIYLSMLVCIYLSTYVFICLHVSILPSISILFSISSYMTKPISYILTIWKKKTAVFCLWNKWFKDVLRQNMKKYNIGINSWKSSAIDRNLWRSVVSNLQIQTINLTRGKRKTSKIEKKNLNLIYHPEQLEFQRTFQIEIGLINNFRVYKAN